MTNNGEFAPTFTLMRANIPNAVTLLNLFFGCCAVVLALQGRPDLSLWCTLGSFLCDYTDGMLARLLGVASPLGKQLDSLADMVSFGVVPGMLTFGLLSPDFTLAWSALPAFALPVFAAYRLGKFNIDTRQSDYFLGLSTPAMTVFVLGVSSGAYSDLTGFGDLLRQQPWLLYGMVAALCLLMVAEIPMAGLKIRSGGLRDNTGILLFAGLFLLLFLWIKHLAFSAIIVVYVVFSLFSRRHIVLPKNKTD